MQAPWTVWSSCTERMESEESTEALLWPLWEVLTVWKQGAFMCSGSDLKLGTSQLEFFQNHHNFEFSGIQNRSSYEGETRVTMLYIGVSNGTSTQQQSQPHRLFSLIDSCNFELHWQFVTLCLRCASQWNVLHDLWMAEEHSYTRGQEVSVCWRHHLISFTVVRVKLPDVHSWINLWLIGEWIFFTAPLSSVFPVFSLLEGWLEFSTGLLPSHPTSSNPAFKQVCL